MSTTFSISPLLFQQFVGDFHPRKLLLLNPLSQPPSIASPSPSGKIQDPLNPNANGDKHFDVNVVMVLVVLICALLISLGLNYFIRRRLTETCQKIAGVSQVSSSEPPPSVVQERVVNMATLEREGLVCHCREAS
ncbi:hypothetical protein OIU77_016519 [Salix suchowensis]|uniref:RING-type E3 ubiquitin transferase n=1 Tax=Salix suchowensis TaxID=1278906 RepID=A0ABQ8ZKR5_9ROSI|nr:hypothetical protein OIU77_016519 [Salix suchowensis]